MRPALLTAEQTLLVGRHVPSQLSHRVTIVSNCVLERGGGGGGGKSNEGEPSAGVRTTFGSWGRPGGGGGGDHRPRNHSDRFDGVVLSADEGPRFGVAGSGWRAGDAVAEGRRPPTAPGPLSTGASLADTQRRVGGPRAMWGAERRAAGTRGQGPQGGGGGTPTKATRRSDVKLWCARRREWPGARPKKEAK